MKPLWGQMRNSYQNSLIMRQSLTALFCLLTAFSFAQNAFRDAERLADLLTWNPDSLRWEAQFTDPDKFNEAMTILANYAWDEDNNGEISQNEFNNQNEGNPMIYVTYQEFTFVETAVAVLKTGGGIAGGGSGMVTNIADGTAKFLVKRTREELSLAFFGKLKKELDENADLQLFFPESTRLLGLIDTKIYDFSTYLSNLRETFIKDFRFLPGHMANYLQNHQVDWEGEFGITVGALATDCFQMIQDGWDERPVVEQLNYFGSRRSAIVLQKDKFTNPDLKKAIAALETMQLFNRAFQNSQSEGLSFVNTKNLDGFARNQPKTALFLGLLWMDGRGIELGNGRSVRDGLAGLTKQLHRSHEFWNDLQSFAKTGREMQSSLEEIRKIVSTDAALKSTVADRMEQYLIGLTRLAEFGFRFRAYLTPQGSNAIINSSELIIRTAEDYRLIEILRRSQEILFDARQKKYTAAISDVLLLLDLIYELKNKKPELTDADKTAAGKHAIETAQQAIDDVLATVEQAKQAAAAGKAAAEKAIAEGKATAEQVAAEAQTAASQAAEIGKEVIRQAAEQAVKEGKLAVVSSEKEFEEAVKILLDLMNKGTISPEMESKLKALAIDAADDFLEKNVKDLARFEKNLVRYGNFLAAAAEAQNSEDVAKAIEAFALPVGSSRLKKHSSFSIALNAYPGLGWRGDERSFGSIFKKSTSSFVIPAPIGLNLNWGFGNCGSVSFYAPLIDVGALFAFRFTNDTTIVRPQLKWSNIISPGFYVVYGSGWDLPISVGIGGQRSPTLKKIGPGGNIELVEKRQFVPQIFVGVDIPIAHFYTARRK